MRPRDFILLLAVLATSTLSAAERPNILFAIADDASFPHMGAYGCEWVKTPGFDRVAREGLLFMRAYTPNAKCAPSRACVLTGRNSWQLEEAANHWPYFPAKFKVYTEALSEDGYFVGSTGKGWGPGVAKDADGRPRTLAGKAYQGRKAKSPTKAISNTDYAANFVDFLNEIPGDEPFCFWYGGHEPHRGYEYRSGIEKGGKSLEEIDRVPGYWPDNETVRADMLDYAYEIEHFDTHLAKMLDELERRGELDNTLIVVTADNGAPFPRIKGQEYEASNHLPLAIMWKKGIESPGREVDDFVSFIDLAPTFVEVAGLDWEQTGMASTPGRPLTDIFAAKEGVAIGPPRDHVLIGKERHDIGRPFDWGYPIRGIVTKDLLYLRNFEPERWPAGNPETGYLNTDGSPTKTVILDGRTDPELQRFWELAFGKRPAEELYNLSEDPDCLENVAQDGAYSARRNELNDKMLRELSDQDDPRIAGRGEVFDNYPYADESGRGFYERYRLGEKVKAGWVNESDFEDGPLE